jgi:hypothetical protein
MSTHSKISGKKGRKKERTSRDLAAKRDLLLGMLGEHGRDKMVLITRVKKQNLCAFNLAETPIKRKCTPTNLHQKQAWQSCKQVCFIPESTKILDLEFQARVPLEYSLLAELVF